MSATTDELRRELALAMGVQFCPHEKLSGCECCIRCGYNPAFFPHVDLATMRPLPALTLDWVHDCVQAQKLTPSREEEFKNALYNVFAYQDGFRDGAQVIANATAEHRAQALLAVLKQRQSLPERLEGEK